MPSEHSPKRRYHAPKRLAEAQRRRHAVVHAATRAFETHGWSGTTMRMVSERAAVSLKTVEALFGTKAQLLRAAVDYAIRGDTDPRPMPQRQAIGEMEAAADASAMLALHAAHVRAVNERSARIAWVVEQAAASDEVVLELWRQMNRNRAFGIRWATETLLDKPGRKRDTTREDVEAVFWVALDWGTFRTLTEHAGLTADGFEAWLRRYYTELLLDGP